MSLHQQMPRLRPHRSALVLLAAAVAEVAKAAEAAEGAAALGPIAPEIQGAPLW